MRSVQPMIFYNISGGNEDHHKADGARQTAAHWSGRLSKIPRTWSSNWKRAKEGDLSTRRCARSFGKAAHSSANLAWEGCGLGSGPHTGLDGSAAPHWTLVAFEPGVKQIFCSSEYNSPWIMWREYSEHKQWFHYLTLITSWQHVIQYFSDG